MKYQFYFICPLCSQKNIILENNKINENEKVILEFTCEKENEMLFICGKCKSKILFGIKNVIEKEK